MIFGLFSRDPEYGNISDRDNEKKFIIGSFLKTETVTYRATCNLNRFNRSFYSSTLLYL